MIRMIGSCLILLAAVLYLLEEKKDRQRQERTVQDLLAAVESIETAIRWEKQTLPDSIAEQEKRKYAGIYFRKISKLLQSNIALQYAWEKSFIQMKPVEISQILCDISLSGDSTFLIDNLSFAATKIREFQAQKRAEQATKQKLKVTAALSGAGAIIVLLL